MNILEAFALLSSVGVRVYFENYEDISVLANIYDDRGRFICEVDVGNLDLVDLISEIVEAVQERGLEEVKV